jgi:S-adenosylmethionine:tRNA ribosyltransferase-isomerase
MKTSDFDYILPKELIAQSPLETRDQSRLMVINRSSGSLKHQRFFQLTDYLHEGDVLVFNDSRVIPARLSGRKLGSGGKLEILLIRQHEPNVWETLVKPGKRLKIGTSIEISGNPATDNRDCTGVFALVVESGKEGTWFIEFSDKNSLSELGIIPLPPYIHIPLQNPERYQTVYSNIEGSIAAPTAGLHFTKELIDKIEKMNVQCLYVTLHVGLDTFRPVREDEPNNHPIHTEYGIIKPAVASQLSKALIEERRIICVGTTTVRLIEAIAQNNNLPDIQPFSGWVDLFILPGYRFRIVDSVITNFHLPKTTLLMMVTAFAGNELIRQAYREAIEKKYRFYSFGDAMMII